MRRRVNYFRPRNDGLPSGVNLPTFLMEGPLTWPGQHAGFLGPRHDPWQITRDPNGPTSAWTACVPRKASTPAGSTIVGRCSPRSMLSNGNSLVSAEGRRLSDQQQAAFSMLTSGRIAQAFEMDREPTAVRDRYGRHAFGQSLLLARRLVQAGVPVVQANMGSVQNWDTHGDNFSRLKNTLLPPLDQGVSALLDDLEASGLLDDTLVMMLGEFGRTPKIFAVGAGAIPGRDHWAPCFFGVFAGAGVRGGQVIGQSDRIGAYPVDDAVFARRHRRDGVSRAGRRSGGRGARPAESAGAAQPRRGDPGAVHGTGGIGPDSFFGFAPSPGIRYSESQGFGSTLTPGCW